MLTDKYDLDLIHIDNYLIELEDLVGKNLIKNTRHLL